MNNFLITGITGQDGIFLTKKILSNDPDCKVFGTTRNPNSSIFYKKLSSITSFDKSRINIVKLDLEDKNLLQKLLSDLLPTQIYNFSGPSSVYESYKNPSKSMQQIKDIFNNLTESLIDLKHFPKLFQASSSEMFGKNSKLLLNTADKFLPISPYAKAKYENHKKVLMLNKKYDWEIFSGIMFNHESEFRHNDYLIMKIISSAREILKNEIEYFTLGSLEYRRDWLYAEDTVDAVYKIMQNNKSPTHIISSGVTHSIKDIVEIVFKYFDLNWKNHIKIDKKLLRQGDPVEISGDPNRLIEETGWKQKYDFESTILQILNSKTS